MREIKFKFWQKEDKEMSEPYTLEDGFTGGQPSAYCFLERDCIALQYTGLKDKNGKEIYEGDVVKHDNGDNYPIAFDDWNGRYVFERNDDIGNLPILKAHILHCEVIGNIYEHSNLLDNTEQII